ncbi:MAG: hypothetical protein UT86_C0004G0062 [Candidatus Magasanikbacteria bacterium GW2011_GWC2_40_17]|uniref:Sugar 3,4-ketoisomerase QdtA cupin domain-containing protein n=1 Tax=Candidatus Magasanikbacteria bacterium GW2011_GWA2_42_32 TaxID=1619039 RepID=A0A0G1A7V7_9BACT|nr:MAG: hypothetical protein UT86_C0004G0062 [Candidatus Magasanikbacteria bacterium GW2011_GWC2_40_17]KKS57120.1 MAG: hypothetical protein UV20_C0003G0062 [Candidatus Magasanikbacteria bacterium GW2011_GWA2_42_32]OGH85358.1 MAG: hypothetical protein A2294_01150 [Candidatus Magasanikbacteria bacterium RIFOXYB2_FULL_38_10]
MTEKFKSFQLKEIVTPNFKMHPLELKNYLDFEVKRVYYLTDPTDKTGAHCHKVEKEFFILLQGTATAIIDKGNGLEEIKMAGPLSAVYVSSLVWHHFKDFSSDAILLALSSTNYNPDRSDYVEDYQEFLSLVGTK